MTDAHMIPALAERLARALDDPEARSAMLGLEERIALVVGDGTVGLVPGAGAYQAVPGPVTGATLRLVTDPEAWAAALARTAPPGFQSLTALLRTGRLKAEGDPISLARSLHLIERLIEVLRGRAEPLRAPPVARDVGQIEGRYHSLALPDGERTTVYAERAGEGIPVVFLHTAGADSRQYLALLADVELARRCRSWAFDLPMHGRSMPRTSWDGGRVELTQASYQAVCVAFLEQVVQGPAVVVGCSMGAAMALVLAAARPDLVRGAIAVEAPLRARGRRNPALAHARVNSAAHNPSYVRGLMSPLAAESARRDAAWIYGQGGLGIYAGDLAFYEEFDGAAIAPRIDAGRTPIALLTGAYDYSASPDDARRLAALIPGASVGVMPELGHFPMVESPDLFRTYFAPALDRVLAAGGGAR